MADTTLTKDGAPKTITLSSTNVARVVVPAGCRHIEVACSAAFFRQIDTTQAIADNAAITSANVMYYPAGHYWLPVDGVGTGVRYELFASTSATPSLYVRAVSRVA